MGRPQYSSRRTMVPLLALLTSILLALLQPALCFAIVPPPQSSASNSPLLPPLPHQEQKRGLSSSKSRSGPLLYVLTRRRQHFSPTSALHGHSLDPLRGPDVPPPPPPDLHPESAENFLTFLMKWPFGDLPEVRPVTFAAMVWTVAVAYAYRQGLIAPVDVTPHSLLSGPLGFTPGSFLTFRANEGYNRCNEARAVWDSVLNTSRDIIRAIVASEHLIGGAIPARRLLDLTCAYGVCLEEFVTGETRELELHRLLRPPDFERLRAAPAGSNRPLVMTELLAEEVVRTARARPEFQSSPHLSRILGFIDSLGHHITTCQRLSKPHVPRIFYAHALRLLTLWCFTLPFALLDKFPSAKTLVAAMALVTWALFGLRELGVRAQYPFSWGYVDLKRLWREVLWDSRLILEGGEQAAKAAIEADEVKQQGLAREEEEGG